MRTRFNISGSPSIIALPDMLSRQKNLINDFIMTFMSSDYLLQNRHKTRNRFNISGPSSTIAFKFCQIC